MVYCEALRNGTAARSGAVFEAPTLVAGLDDFAVVGQAVEQRGRHLGVAKHTRPLAKGEVGGDDNGGALVEPAHQVEKQLATGVSEGQIAEFVEHDQVHAGEIFGEPALSIGAGFVLQPVDEVDDSVEAAAGAAADAGAGDGNGKMALAGTGSPDQHGVTLLGEEAAAGQVADQGLVDRRAGKVEVMDIPSSLTPSPSRSAGLEGRGARTIPY